MAKILIYHEKSIQKVVDSLNIHVAFSLLTDLFKIQIFKFECL